MDTNGEVTEAPAVEKPTEDKLTGMLSGDSLEFDQVV